MYYHMKIKLDIIVISICITFISAIAFHFGEIIITYIGLSSLIAYLLGRFHNHKGGEKIVEKHALLIKKYLTEITPETKELIRKELEKEKITTSAIK